MKKLGLMLIATLLLGLTLPALCQAADEEMAIEQKIYETQVNVTFKFDLKETSSENTAPMSEAEAAALESMEEDDRGMPSPPTYHLLVTIYDAEGKAITTAKVKMLIVAPDEMEQTVTPALDGDGYSAEVNFSQDGRYLVTCQALMGEKTVTVDFAHTMEHF